MSSPASLSGQSLALPDVGFLAVAIIASLTSLHYYLLPKPIKGIPYNTSATATLLGDIPAMIKESNNNIFTWMTQQAQKFSSPICQLFILPFGKPVVYISDYHEAQDIMMRRKEFDRSDWSIEILGGIGPNHHINLKTGPVWKAHRRLLQDLMTPKFLHNVAGRNIYSSASRLVALWDKKTRIATGRPFAANKDIYYTALDAVLDFTFGDNFACRALLPQIEIIETANETSAGPASIDAVTEFPTAPVDTIIMAILQCAEAVGEVSNQAFVALAWWWKKLQPEERKFRAIRRTFLKEQVMKSRARLNLNANPHNEDWITSAADLMLQRERIFAEKDGREPVYWNETIHDEIIGFVIAGHDTTSTTLCWGVKFLADNQVNQDLLRKSLQHAHATAFTEKRPPTYQEITKASIPYLDAVIEEILRLGQTIPILERQCSQDTVILGHPIPKGTTVIMPGSGPGITEPSFEIDDSLRNESSRNALAEKGKRAWPMDSMNEFRPERWLPGAEDEKQSFDGAAGPTLPFGLGTRGCFGRKLAYLELKLVLTLIVWNFELQPCPEELSSYKDILGLTRAPEHCYVRPKRIMLQ